MRKWISLLMAVLLVFAAASAAFTEAGDDADGAVQMSEDASGMEDDGDDSVQIPVDMPGDEDEEAEEDGDEAQGGEKTSMELRPLDVGDEGEDVLFLQMRLKSLQYFSGNEDGKYGKDTQAAVRKFQEDNANQGLEATGIADTATQLLLASARYRGLKYGSEGEDVKELQTRLTMLGYYTGKISGNFLEGTQNGIKQFQKNNGLEITGIADPLTQEAVFSDGAVGRHDVEETSPTPTPYNDMSWYLVDENDTGIPMPEAPVAYQGELKKGSKNDAVKALQERMQQLGYFDGPISGNYQDKTAKAVKKIQEQNGMTVTGKVDDTTWNLIFNNPGIVMPDATPKPSPTPEPVPFAITVDVKNQIVSVYTRDEDGNYTIPVRQMLCSSGKVGTPSPVGDWVLNGRKAKWCYFPKWGDYARYWTRINSKVAFHSPIYSEVSLKAMKIQSYKMLGSRASHGCVRLSVADAKWIYDNVGAGTVVSIREDLPADEELKEALKHDKPANPNDDPPVNTPEPEYNRDAVPEIRGWLTYDTRNEAVYWMQCRLKELGYYTTKCTGHMLSRTVTAVKAFQKDHGFSQNGNADQNVLNAMAAAEKITPEPEEIPPEATPAP